MNATADAKLPVNLPRAVIFDLDGTLVTSSLDFVQLCHETGCTPGEDILSFVKTLPDEQRMAADRVIYQHEMRDAETSQVIAGVESALSELQRLGVNTAIVTRNSQQATRIKLERSRLPITHVITREDAAPKPSPDALLQIAQHWAFDPEECVYVGDFRYDLEAAHNAQMHAAWFSNGTTPAPTYSEMAHFSFDHYDHFITRLKRYWLAFKS